MDLSVTWNKLVAYSVSSYLESAVGSKLVLYMYVGNILYQNNEYELKQKATLLNKIRAHSRILC